MSDDKRRTRKRKSSGGDGASPHKIHQQSSNGECHADKEEECGLCREIVNTMKYAGTVLSMHVDIRNISPPKGQKTQEKKAEEREKKVKEKTRILEKICALRNTNGGCLLVYFAKMEKSDTFLGDFDEMMDDRLQELIEDGTLFSDSYRREWHKEHRHVLCITCNSSAALSTLDYKIRMSLNKGLTRPTALNMRYLLTSHKSLSPYEEIPLKGVQEQTNLQMKSFRDYDFNSTSFDVAEHILKKLRLREYISAFANQKSGGYYFLGVAEKDQDSQDYHKKMITLEGFHMSEEKRRSLQADIRQLVKREMLWVDREMKDHNAEKIDGSIKISFREVNDGVFIMEVFVHPVEGVVFYDKSGPVSLHLSVDNELEMIDIVSWHEKIQQITIPSE